MYSEDPGRYGLDTALYQLYPPPEAQQHHRPGDKGYLANAASRAIAAREGLPTPEQLARAWENRR